MVCDGLKWLQEQRAVYWVGLVLLLLLPARTASAHGDVMIASGTSPSGNYGWMLSVSPYPVLTGPVSLSLLVFDNKTSAIVNTVTGELFLAAPDSPRPCCEPETHLGPFPLLLEPLQFGDYIAYVPIDQLGRWEVQLRLTVAGDSFTLVATIEVTEDGNWEPAALQAAVAELTQAAQNPAQAPSPLAAAGASAAPQPPSPLSPLPTPLPTLATQPTQPPVVIPVAVPAGRMAQNWLIGGGVLAVGVGVALLWWQRSKQKV